MKFRFRVTLLALLVGLVVLTISAVGAFSFYNARAAAQELADQVLDQTSLRIEQQVRRLLREATGPAALTGRLIDAGQLREPAGIVRYWGETLAVNPNVTGLFIGWNATGEGAGVSRLSENKVSIWQTTVPTGAAAAAATRPVRLELREYLPEAYPDKPYRFDPAGGPDIRTRPWFVAAERAGLPVWTDSYAFLGVKGMSDVLGVTYAVPVYRADHSLDSVVEADFGLAALGQFLKKVRVGQDGQAFLVELRADGSKRVIAHPRDDLALSAPAAGGAGGRELIPADRLADERVRALVAQLPAGLGTDGAAAAGAVRFRAEGRAFLGGYRRIEGARAPRWVVCTVMPEDDVLARAYHSSLMTFLIMLAALCLAIAASVLVSRQIARPLEALAREAAAVGHLRLEARPRVRSVVLEVDRLAAASDEMRGGLRSFQKFVPVDLVRGLLDTGQEARLGGERRVVSIFFSDIANFTTISESMGSEALVAHLGDYFGAMSDAIAQTGGEVDKFIGDSVMAFWGAPAANPQHATSAAVAAWRCQQRLRERRAEWVAAGRPACDTRIGVNTGEVIVGIIGSAARMDYTVMGDAVNLASRLEGLNKYYATEILISEATHAEAKGAVVARPVDWVKVKGKTQAILVYEMLGLASEAVPAETVEFAARYGRALAAYRAMRWQEAIAGFESAMKIRPGDRPAAMMIGRCRSFIEKGPGEGWDGAFRMDEK